MNFYKYDIVFQEVPGEISLAFYMTGCGLRCSGCHSPELWVATNGRPLMPPLFDQLIQRYYPDVSCVLFMGGDWEPLWLSYYLGRAQRQGLKTALYTGREIDELPQGVLSRLDFLKTGPWRSELGGLNSPSTNQKFYRLKEEACLFDSVMSN
jgi:anaerobic ribonucleoside-triphosphate reductase activating protein